MSNDQIQSKLLSKKILRVDAATPLSDKWYEIRQRRASHTAVFAQETCLGVANVKLLDGPPQETTFGDLIERQNCKIVLESSSIEELARSFEDPDIEALVVQNDQAGFVGIVTRQSLLEGLLEERGQPNQSSRRRSLTEHERAESLLAGEKRVLEIISTSCSPDGGLTELVEFVESQCEGVICSILLLDETKACLRNGAAKNLPEAFVRLIDEMEIGPNAGACGAAAYLNETVVVSDISRDPRCANVWELALENKLHACCSHPIRSPSGDVLGTISIYFDRPQTPDRNQEAVIDRAVYLAAIAIERKRAEDALRASEARNRTLLEGSPVCTKIIDLDSRLQYMSSAGQNQLKICDIEPFYGSTFPPELYPESWRAPVTEHLERAKEGEVCSLECPVRDTDGREVWYDTTFVPARDENGRVKYVIVTSVNITERRKVEDALRASEARNRTLLEGSPVCTKIIDLDSRLQYMSSAGQNQLKICEIEPFYGSKFPPDLYPEPWRAPVSEHLERAKAGETSSLECPVLDTEGREIWYDTTFVPARDDDGRVKYVIVTSVNVTERKEMEDELTTIFDMSLDLICVATINTATFVKVNPSFLRVLGYSEDELVGQSYLDFIHPDDVGPTIEIIDRYLKRGRKVMRFENRYRTKDGDYRWLTWTSNPNAANGLTYAIAHDITDRKKAEEQARKHRDELAHVSRVSTMGEMATGIAHELNQPLAAIASFSFSARTIVERLPSRPHELEELLDKVEEQSIRAGEIVRRLRNYVAKTESARMPVDLNTLVRDVAKFVEPDIRQADVILALKLDETPPVALIDEIQIQQVLVNLIKNAIDALRETPAGHRNVTVSTRTLLDGNAEVIVSDAGKGLSQSEMDQAFNTFFSTKHDGMGMGLPISRSIIDAHGGKLWSKQNAGRGATFGFTIPCENERESDDQPTVFIVDDEPALRDAVSRIVKALGLSTKCFASAVEFLGVIEPYHISSPVCLIVDMQMPTITGLELLEKLDKLGKHLPAIMITGHVSQALERKAKELGAVAVLEKPFRPAELQEIISANLRQNDIV